MAFGSVTDARTTPFDTVQWDVGLVLSDEDSIPLLALVDEEIAKQRSTNRNFPKVNDKLRLPYRPSMKKNDAGDKELVEGEMLWSFKRKFEIKQRNGELKRNNPPVIYDSLGRVCTEKVPMVGSNTILKVVYDVFSYGNNMGAGVSFGLVGIQIVELVAPKVMELEPIEGGFIAPDSEDDEVPF